MTEPDFAQRQVNDLDENSVSHPGSVREERQIREECCDANHAGQPIA